jgi:hypothetical protein
MCTRMYNTIHVQIQVIKFLNKTKVTEKKSSPKLIHLYQLNAWSYFDSYTPIERILKSKIFIFQNFLKNDPIRGNFMMKTH